MDIKSGFDLFNSKNAKRIKYRFVVLRDDSFKEVASLKLTKRNIAILGSTIFVSLIFLTAILIIYTPLKYYIPGYQGDFGYRSKIMKLQYETDSIESAMYMNNIKLLNLNNVLKGDFDSTYSKKAVKLTTKVDTSNIYSISEDEMLLREQVLAEQKGFTKSYSSKSSNSNIPLYELNFFPPTKGYIISKYDAKTNHYGIDIASPADEPVKSCLDGTVISSNWTLDGGYEITIQHSNNLISSYKHNSKILKKVGSVVKAGDVISIIGNSGEQTTGPHLHFELWNNGVAINPTDYIKF
jgi:murein DD-endopeptidase MepM/ murein hydrolase activator NlpD